MAFRPPPMVITDNSVCIVLDGEAYTMDQTNKHFSALKQAIEEEEWNKVRELMGIPNNRWGILEF